MCMYVFMCVCMYVCMCACRCVCVCVCVCMCTYVCLCMCVYVVRVGVWMCECVDVFMRVSCEWMRREFQFVRTWMNRTGSSPERTNCEEGRRQTAFTEFGQIKKKLQKKERDGQKALTDFGQEKNSTEEGKRRQRANRLW